MNNENKFRAINFQIKLAVIGLLALAVFIPATAAEASTAILDEPGSVAIIVRVRAIFGHPERRRRA